MRLMSSLKWGGSNMLTRTEMEQQREAIDAFKAEAKKLHDKLLSDMASLSRSFPGADEAMKDARGWLPDFTSDFVWTTVRSMQKDVEEAEEYYSLCDAGADRADYMSRVL